MLTLPQRRRQPSRTELLEQIQVLQAKVTDWETAFAIIGSARSQACQHASRPARFSRLVACRISTGLHIDGYRRA